MQKTLNRALPASMVAATILILPYSHYVYSRADWYHLCRGISPFLLATIIFIASKKKRIGWVLIVVLFSSSLWVMHNKHPYWQCKYGSGCVDLEISGTTLLVNSQTKSIVDYSRLFVEKYANNNKGFLAVPSLVSLYPIMERKAPVWETYPLFHRSSSFQLEEIERIKSAKTSLVILDNSPIDGNDELRYKNTHKLIYSYILENFEMHPISRKSNYDIYVRKTEL